MFLHHSFVLFAGVLRGPNSSCLATKLDNSKKKRFRVVNRTWRLLTQKTLSQDLVNSSALVFALFAGFVGERRRRKQSIYYVYSQQLIITFFGVQTEMAFARRLHWAIFHCTVCCCMLLMLGLSSRSLRRSSLLSLTFELFTLSRRSLRFLLSTRSPTHTNMDTGEKKEPAWRQKRRLSVRLCTTPPDRIKNLRH